MGKSKYISANLTSKQLEFLRLIDEHEIDIFTISEIEAKIATKFDNLNEILENLVHKKLLSRIEKGKFCKTNFKDENVIGCYLVSDGVIAYWSALNKHGLTEQFPETIYIQTTKNKKNKNVFGSNYKFITVAGKKIAGVIIEGFGNRQYRITNIEKTIVDCFDIPEYSGGYAELLHAFSLAKLNSEKMIEYCIAIDNISSIKRMGFLAEQLNKKGLKSFINFAKQKVNKKYTLFDSFGNDKGEFVSDWKLRLNISKEDILEICNKQY